MGETKFTKGVWSADQADTELPGHPACRDVVAQRPTGGPRVNGGYIVASFFGPDRISNAQLCAAAPAMYEALAEVLPMLEALLMIRGEPKPSSIGHKARAALAAARGEEAK